jgi:hypothetical protein
MSISNRGNFPDSCSSCREYLRLHPIDLCMQVVDSSRYFVYKYLLLFFIVFLLFSFILNT